MNEIPPRCHIQDCGDKATIHCTVAEQGGGTEQLHYCEYHAATFVAPYNSRHVSERGTPFRNSEGVAFEIELILVDERNYSTTCVYMRELGGTRRFRLAMGVFEATALDRELRSERYIRPLTHHAMHEVIKALTGTLEDVLIDRFERAQMVFHAKLRIRQLNQHIQVDVRPSDACILAIIADVPILVAEDVLADLFRADKEDRRR